MWRSVLLQQTFVEWHHFPAEVVLNTGELAAHIHTQYHATLLSFEMLGETLGCLQAACLPVLFELTPVALIVPRPQPALEPQCMVEDKLVHNGHANSMHTACRCPYYRTAEHGLYGTLTLGDTDNQGLYFDSYWSSLTTTTLTTSSPDQCGINLPGYPDKFKSAFMADPNNPTCGEYLQFTSQYPGKGPCYPVLVPTVEHLNRCHSISQIAAYALLFAGLHIIWIQCSVQSRMSS